LFFYASDLAVILRLHVLIRGNATKLSEAWNAYFNGWGGLTLRPQRHGERRRAYG
jgi:hypothetical protein